MKKYLLDKIIAWLVGGSLYSAITDIVRSLVDEDLTGEEKQKAAKERAKELGQDTKTFLLNLAIEASVATLALEKTKKK